MLMNKLRYGISLTLMLLAISVAGQKAVFVIADGIPADVIERASMPNIRSIIHAGS
jgi:hypothetical protein